MEIDMSSYPGKIGDVVYLVMPTDNMLAATIEVGRIEDYNIKYTANGFCLNSVVIRNIGHDYRDHRDPTSFGRRVFFVMELREEKKKAVGG